MKNSLNKDITIIVCTTFRDFKRNENDRIQLRFLQSLKRQNYKNWKLVATVFNEKNVEKVLNVSGINSVVYHHPLVDHRFSLTTVFLNGIKQLRKGRSVLLWTTCDVIFDDDFFSKIIEHYSAGFSGTSHPHFYYKHSSDIGRNSSPSFTVNSGLDLVFFDGNIFLDATGAKLCITQYPNYDWGLFEHFLTGIAKRFSTRMINLLPESQVSKIENDRKPNAETHAWLMNSWRRNREVLHRFIHEKNIDCSIISLTRCHMMYQLISKKRSDYLKTIYAKYFFSIDFIKDELSIVCEHISKSSVK